MQTPFLSNQPPWLISRRADFWLAGAGASVALLVALLIVFWHGDRELDWLDLVLSEFHLGATYGAIIRRRLWRHRQVDVLLIPAFILALTYVLAMTGQTLWLTSIAMYAAVWHRGRQSFGVARYYQHQVGGPVSYAHDVLFRGAIYLPMLAGTLAYTCLAPVEYDGEPYFALTIGAEMTSLIGVAAALWVTAYVSWTLLQSRAARMIDGTQIPSPQVHPAERWVVLAHTVAFGAGYVLGAANASFLFVLAVHHEVQYLYFTYAMARRLQRFHAQNKAEIDGATRSVEAQSSWQGGSAVRAELKHAASFLVWPVIGFVGAMSGAWLELAWLAPLGMGGLFCHYWLDGRIWTRQSFQK